MNEKLVFKKVDGIYCTYMNTEDFVGNEQQILVCRLCIGALPNKQCPGCQQLVCEDCMTEKNMCTACCETTKL